MRQTAIRVLVVDDHHAWRHFICEMIRQRPEFHLVGEAADGRQGLERIHELRPELVLLDIGLPKLNGIEVTQLVRSKVPGTKILIVSETRAHEVVEEALRVGANGYVLKSSAGAELFSAIEAVFHGTLFVSAQIISRDFRDPSVFNNSGGLKNIHRHDVEFYVDDKAFVEGFSRYVETALRTQCPVIAVVTESHCEGILEKLKTHGLDVEAAIKQERYIVIDVADALPRLLLDQNPDRSRCGAMLDELITTARNASKSTSSAVATCGECAPTLLAQGNLEGAIRLERLWDEITRGYGASTLCGYLQGACGMGSSDAFKRISAEHTTSQWELA